MPFISSKLDQNIHIIVRDIVIFMLLVTGVIKRTNLYSAKDRYIRTTIYFSSYFLSGKKMTSRDDVQKSYLSGRWRDIMTTCFVAFLSKIYL